MKKFISRCISYILSTGIGYLVFTVFVALSTTYTPDIESFFYSNSTEYGHTRERNYDLKKWLKDQDTPKGLLLGSSTVYRNIDPFLLSNNTGYNFFNCGSSSQTISTSYNLLKHIIKYTPPEIVVLDIFPELWNNNGVESALDWTINTNKTEPYIVDMALSTNSLKVYYHLSYHLIKNMLPVAKHYSVENNNNCRYVGKGFVITESSKEHKNDNIKTDAIQMFDKNRLALLAIKKICHDNNIEIIFLIPKSKQPLVIDMEVMPNNIDLLNANIVPVQDSCFYDHCHMLKCGNITYTNWLSKKINEQK